MAIRRTFLPAIMAVQTTSSAARAGWLGYCLTFLLVATLAACKHDHQPVTPGNTTPVANAGADQTVTAGSTITLNGSGSSDVDGNPLTFAWTLIVKPAGSTATLVN